MIVSNPPLQHFHKECGFRDIDETIGESFQSIIDELKSKNISIIEIVSNLNEDYRDSRVKLRRRVIPYSNTNASKYTSGRLKLITALEIGSSSMPTGESLAEYWKVGGIHYSEADLHRIVQVLVELDSQTTRSVYHYPADQVFIPKGVSTQCNYDAQRAVELWEKLLSGQSISLDDPESKRVNPRCGFRASDGYQLLSVDYSQLELRLLAHFSDDKNLLTAFHEDHDVFKTIASKWLGKSSDQITASERNQIKQVCYAYIYGAGPSFVADKAQCSYQHAKKMMERFMAIYPGLKSFIAAVKEFCRRNGYVETLLGRRRFLPEISGSDHAERMHAERQAVNTVCQGSAADLMKLAMINSHHSLDLLARKGLLRFRGKRSVPGGAAYCTSSDDVRILLQVTT